MKKTRIGIKDGYAIGKIKVELTKEGQKAFMMLDDEEKLRLAHLQRTNDPRLNEEINKALGMEEKIMTKNEKKQERFEKGIERKGLNNPSEVTSNAIMSQNKAGNFEDIYDLVGRGSTMLSQKEQAKFKHYSEMRKNTFVQIAQNDEIVKQNKKLLEQNDEIISLLKQIANKGEM
ncbi:hypothetical protein ACXXGU_09300 [Staphylococcus epidermidis]